MGKREQWQAYVDDALIKTGLVCKAAIHGMDGTQWAASKNLQVSVCQQYRDTVNGTVTVSNILIRELVCSVAVRLDCLFSGRVHVVLS